MSGMKCPHCGVDVPASRVAEGRCEACGHKLYELPQPAQPRKPPGAALLGHGQRGPGLNAAAGLLLMAGVGLAGYGGNEVRVSMGASATPAEVSLESLEAGERPPQAYIRIGRHVRLDTRDPGAAKAKGMPTAAGDAPDAVIPIFSMDHPRYREWLRPRDAKAPLPRMQVVLRTRPVGKEPEVAVLMRESPSLSGVVSEPLDEKELARLRKTFPGVVPAALVVIDEGRVPAGLLHAVPVLVLGVLLTLFGAGLWFWGESMGRQGK